MFVSAHLTEMTALEVVKLLRAGEITPSEVLAAQKARVQKAEPLVNAIVTECWDRAGTHAEKLDKLSPQERGPLCGLPVTIKDLTPVAGVRTTFGSRIYSDNVPTTSAALVTHLEAQGGIVSGMTNSPEFGAGGNTFNDVHGATRNPWNLSKSAGGSSGGAAASLAAGTSWLSVGSDFAGSLRTPAAFCGVVGLRPSPGRIPADPGDDMFNDQVVDGPMARNVADAAFFLDMLARRDEKAPRSSAPTERSFLQTAKEPKEKAKIIFSPDLGLGTVLGQVAEIIEKTVGHLEKSGFDITPSALDLRRMDKAYHTFRGLDFLQGLGEHLRDNRALLKPEVIWNIEHGVSLTGADVADAMAARSEGYAALMAAMGDADAMICPATITPAFDVDLRYWGIQDGLGYDKYLDWLSIAYVLTPLGVPVIVLPCGMTDHGLPVGLQIVARPHDEATLLSVASAVEAAIGNWATRATELNESLRRRKD